MTSLNWLSKDKKGSKYATREYDPIKNASIDGTDVKPHDRAVIRALKTNYKPGTGLKVSGDPEKTIFVARLHKETTERTLVKFFKKFGEILHCRVVRDIVTGISKTYAFLEFEKNFSATEAVRKMQDMVIDDCQIIVEHECERILKGWRPRRFGGGFGGKKESGQLRFGGSARPFHKPINVNCKIKFKEINKKKY